MEAAGRRSHGPEGPGRAQPLASMADRAAHSTRVRQVTPSVESLVARALVDAGLEIVDIDASEVRVRQPGAEALCTLGLANLRRLLAAAAPDDHPAVVAEFVGTAVRALAEPRARGPLLPRLLPGGPDPRVEAPWTAELAGGRLRLALVEDREDRVRFVQPFDLVRWKLSIGEARERALRNLRGRSAAASLDAWDGIAGAWRLEVGDGYDAARLLVAEQFFPEASGVMAVVPSRDLLGLVPVEGKHGVEAAGLLWREIQAMVRHLPYPLSRDLFWKSRGGPVEWVRVLAGEDGRVALVLPRDLARIVRS